MVVDKELEDSWLWKIPWMLRWVKLIVLLDCSWKLVVVYGSCCQFIENDELHHYLFFSFLNNGSLIYLTVLLFEPSVISSIHLLWNFQRSVHPTILFC